MLEVMSRLQKKNIMLIGLVMVLSTFGVFQLDTSEAASANDVIYGGVSTESGLRDAFNNGDGRNSASNIQAIFDEAINVTDAQEMTGMDWGTVHRDGRVTVDGETVATDAKSSGRLDFRNSQPLGNTGAYYHDTDIRFSSSTDSLRALVKLDDKGQYEFAVISHCGNPVVAEPVPIPEPQAAFECQDMSATQTHGVESLETTFTATADVDNTEVVEYEWDFGDGNTATSTDSQITHVYDTPGEYTARVNIITEDGETGFSSDCEVSITVLEPDAEFACVDLTASQTSGQDRLEVDFEAIADTENTEVTEYEWDFGDGNTERTTQSQVSYTYDTPGEYTARVNIITEDGETGFRPQCEVEITVTETEEEPRQLPEAGFGSPLLALFGSGMLGGGVRAWIMSRKGLRNSLFNL